MTAYCLGSLLYEGKAKRVYATDRPELVAIEFKDDATAFNALKKAELAGKGELNCQISARLFEYLAARGVPTHYLGVGDTRWMLVRPVRVIPVEVVIRNVAAGSLCKQMPIERGQLLGLKNGRAVGVTMRIRLEQAFGRASHRAGHGRGLTAQPYE